MCPRSKDRISISSSSKKIDGRSIRGKEAARGDTNRNLGRKAGAGGVSSSRRGNQTFVSL